MSQNLDLNNLVPSSYKNELLDALNDNLFNKFLSQETSVNVSGNTGTPVNGVNQIAEPTLERQENSLVPGLSYKAGTETQLFTFNDLVNRANVLGIDTPNMRTWLAEQWYNFSPPINYDKFINYSSYYWIGPSITLTTPTPGWNHNLDREYYVIQQPVPNDAIKMPVRLASTRNISRWMNDRSVEILSFTFTSATTFTVNSNISPGNVYTDITSIPNTQNTQTKVTVKARDENTVPGLSAPGLPDYDLVELYIVTGSSMFSAGDTIDVAITYYTSTVEISVNSPNLNGKGTINGVTTLSPFMYIDGVQIDVGDRILVKDQVDTTQNGIYIATTGGMWSRSFDATYDSNLNVGSIVYVEDGVTQAGFTFELAFKGTIESGGLIDANMIWNIQSTTAVSNINDWQNYNYWVHQDDLYLYSSLGVSISNSLQAQRPIIEYLSTIQLNQAYDSISGNPCDVTDPNAVVYQQVKTRFGQIPQFDLYRYDNTHSGITSGLWYYDESPLADIDDILLRRVNLTTDDDYIFGLGMTDDIGRHLYYKNIKTNSLCGIWRPGPAAAEATSPLFTGTSNHSGSNLSLTSINAQADNQEWTISFSGPYNATISGTRSGTVGTNLTPDVEHVFEDFTVIFLSDAIDYSVGDQFTFQIAAPLTPRYVKLDSNGNVINYPGGAIADEAEVIQTGAWLTPARMFQNVNRELQNEIGFGDFLNHARSVLRAQADFAGASFGNNNSRDLNIDPGLGGQIRDFGSNFPLLASMLMEPELSIATILDFAEYQYNLALSSIDRFILDQLSSYLSTNSMVNSSVISGTDTTIILLEQAFENYRAINSVNSSIFSDTTALIKNWPATLPILGMLPPVAPIIQLDNELNIWVIVHHDGHISPVATFDNSFSSTLIKTFVLRSDGTKSPGIFSDSYPSAIPYAGQLWMMPTSGSMFVFNVNYDTSATPITPTDGQTWYHRGNNVVVVYSAMSDSWTASSNPVSSYWTPFVAENIRNSLLLAVEQKLYSSVHPYQQLNINLVSETASAPAQLLETELASFSAKYGYDTYAPNYNPSDPFSWNYSQLTVSGLSSTPGIARWFDLYKAYFASQGISNLDRPDLQPWQLGTPSFPRSSTKPSGWDAAYKATAVGTTDQVTISVVATSSVSLSGLLTIDGITLTGGALVLVTSQTNATTNGIYVASGGDWSRAPISLVSGLTANIQNGLAYAGTSWVLTSAPPIVVGTTQLIFSQIRTWKSQLWLDVMTSNPGLKFFVNIYTDALLPPYVASSSLASSNALITSIPNGINLGYSFGQNAPVELVWKKSLEYNYGLSRVAFKLDPLYFLDKTWGETYIKASDNIRVERNLQASIPSQKFLLHGEKLNIINTYTPEQVQARFINLNGITWSSTFNGTVEFTVSHCASTGDTSPTPSFTASATVFSIFVNSTFAGYAVEGNPFSLSNSGVTFTNVTINDLGIPFEIGDTLTIYFTTNTITSTTETNTDFVYGILGCEGCVAEGSVEDVVISSTQNQPTYSFNPGQMKVFKGLGQLFTNLIRYNTLDLDCSTSILAYRGWGTNLVHRLGSVVVASTLTIDTQQGEVPTTGYSLLLKKSKGAQDYWISALRVQLVQIGSKTLGSDGLYKPSSDASDWIFRISVYNPLNPQITAYVPNLNAPFTNFTALSGANTKLSWNHYTSDTSTTTYVMPLQVTGLQNTLNIIFGYVDYLTDLGFKINATDTPFTDKETGRNIDWQLEVEKFINQVYSGMSAGEAYILNPFMKKLYFQTPVGILAKYSATKEIDTSSMQACYDVTGSTIPVSNLMVIRTDDQAITTSNTPIFSAHIFLDEYEHAVVFNDQFSNDPTSPTIFNSFLGEYLSNATLAYTKPAVSASKPTYDGFYISGSDFQRNISGSIDSLQSSYDTNKTFENPILSQHALALIGFTTKDYFTNLNISPKVQLDYWRGMISAKGTNLSINAFTNFSSFNNSSVDEFWAYKLATYGDAREKTFPEIKIQSGDCTRHFTSIQFYSAADTSYSALPLFIQVEAEDDGRWYSIDDLGTVLRFDAPLISETVIVTTSGNQYVQLQNIYNNGDNFGPTVTGPAGARIVNASTLFVNQPGTYTVSGYSWTMQTNLSPVKLFDYSANVLEEEIGLWHPAIGIHEYEALEVVNIQSKIDPAHYGYSLLTIDNPNYMALKPWSVREVGRVWWDTSTLSYIPYYDATIFPNRETRNSRWGSLTDYASVDLYQWTESDYHPSEYNAQAALQEGDSTIDTSIRLSGTVGFADSYVAIRQATINAIAWSQTSTSNGLAHPAFGSASSVIIYNSNNQLIAGSGRLADINLVSGYNFGGWDLLNLIPVGEVSIGAVLTYDIGNSNSPGSPILNPVAISSGTILSYSISGSSANPIFGNVIGPVTLSYYTDGISWYLRATSETLAYQDIVLGNWTSSNLQTSTGDTLLLTFDKFGLTIQVQATSSGTITAEDIGVALTNPYNDIFVREAVNYTEVIPLDQESYSNETIYGVTDDIEYGWVAWQIPTQAQLTADLTYPSNKWQPYLGTPQSILVTADIVAQAKAVGSTFLLSNGQTVQRFNSTWSEWVKLAPISLTSISDGVTLTVFNLTTEISLDTTRLSVYSNGIQLAPAQLSIAGNTVTLIYTQSEGSFIYLLYRPYQPTTTDLAFDPTIQDNFQIQNWYKTDYQYTQLTQRDSSGNVSGSKYYFWVRDKTVTPPSQSMSLVEATSLLQYGDSTYMVFCRLVTDTSSSSGVGFDSCAIAGLETIVTDDNTYKLRFLRDFTLRDDPQELKLKNVHTEWTLVREKQTNKIPSTLWLALTNAVCGCDQGGNQLPSQVRINYDAKYGTFTRYGFESGQIFAEQDLVISTLINTILNTSLTISIGSTTITDYITLFNISSNTTADSLESDWFSTPIQSRNTMMQIYSMARASQINELFFEVLNDALANNYEFTDLFKTSFITVNSSINVAVQAQSELSTNFY